MAERIAALVHATPINALHTARILRTATDATGRRLDLWPQSGSGARITSFTSSQPVNLLLALGARDPIRSPEIVAEFRSLRSGTGVWTYVENSWNTLSPSGGSQKVITELENEAPPLLPGPTFGDDLDFVMETLASVDDERREYLRLARVILTLAPVRAAKILIPIGEWNTYHQVDYAGEQTPAPSALYRVLEGSTDETMGAMETLFAIWRENQEAYARQKTKPLQFVPARGRTAAAPSQPSATTREPGRPTPPVLSEREIALNRYAAGPPFIEERPNARYRQLSADDAGR
jgi:hypothetical protein